MGTYRGKEPIPRLGNGPVNSASFFAGCAAAGPPPDIPSPPHEPLNCGGGSVEGRSDVKVEDRLSGGLRWPGVVVDHVADFLGTPRRLA